MKTLHDWGLLVLRIGTAGLLIPHGWSKLNKLITGLQSAEGVRFYNWMGIGETPSLALTVLGEFIAPIFILMGFKTRWAAVPSTITMGVAGFVVHWGDGLSEMEHALLFFFPLVAIMLLGPGKWSIDRR
jgi:putative oxidoreductase